MKKVLLPILPILAIGMLIVLPLFVSAEENPPYTMPTTKIELWGSQGILPKALNWFFNAVIIIGIMMIIYAGYRYMTAGGDDTKVKGAMNNLIFALVGIAIALFAKGLIYLVSHFMGQGVLLN